MKAASLHAWAGKCGMRELPTRRKGMSLAETKRMIDVAHAKWLERHPEQVRYADPVFGRADSLTSRGGARPRVRVPTEVGELAATYLALGKQPRGTMARMAAAHGVRPKALAMAVTRERSRRGMAERREKMMEKFSK